MYIPTDKKTRNWEDYSFVLPCVAVGNVGQLAADVLIASLHMERVGAIYHESILPVVSNDPFSAHRTADCRLTTSCEVYEDTKNKLVVLQQRSPFVKGKKKLYVSWLGDWIKTQRFRQVVVLTSSYAEERLDAQIQGSQFRFLASEAMDKRCGELLRTRLGWLDLEKRAPPQGLNIDNLPGTVYMPGCGIAKQIYETLQADMSSLVMLMFCSEGDNAQDAVAMVSQLNSWLSLKFQSTQGENKGPWVIPSSWRLVFGTRADQTLFH